MRAEVVINQCNWSSSKLNKIWHTEQMLIPEVCSKTPTTRVPDSNLQRDICGLTEALWVSKVPLGTLQQTVIFQQKIQVYLQYYFITTSFCPRQQQYVVLTAMLKTCRQSTHTTILTYKLNKVDIFPWQIQYVQPFPTIFMSSISSDWHDLKEGPAAAALRLLL